MTPTKEEVVKDLKEFKLKNKRLLPDEPRSNASSGLPAENESVKPSDEDPKPKRAREEKCGCIDRCSCAVELAVEARVSVERGIGVQVSNGEPIVNHF